MTTFPASPSAADDQRVIDVGWATATGPRDENQDRAAVSPRWAVVSDGAGGHAGGARAAQLSVDAVVDRLAAAGQAVDDEVARRAAADANDAVRAGRAADPSVEKMAATLTFAVARAATPIGSTWSLVAVGDSPAWLLAGGKLRRVTEADNVATELVRAGVISRAEARRHPGRHLVTRAMGTDDTVTASPVTVSLRPGDALVLATDGVEVLDEAAMMEAMSSSSDSTAAARRLVAAALAHGTSDNVTVVVIRHRDDTAPEGPAGALG